MTTIYSSHFKPASDVTVCSAENDDGQHDVDSGRVSCLDGVCLPDLHRDWQRETPVVQPPYHYTQHALHNLRPHV